jgi:hypothetical protein
VRVAVVGVAVLVAFFVVFFAVVSLFPCLMALGFFFFLAV